MSPLGGVRGGGLTGQEGKASRGEGGKAINEEEKEYEKGKKEYNY